jgi:hypothetical protein
MRKLLVVLILVGVAVSANAQDSYKKKVQTYLEASGSMEAFKIAIKAMIGNVRKMKTEIPDDFFVELEKEMLATSLTDLVDLMEPIYRKHFSESELDEIIRFYKSPVGLKLSEKTPAIAQESIQAGQVWGQKIGGNIVEKMKAKGYKLD